MIATVVAFSVSVSAGNFVIKTADVVLWRGETNSVLVLHNPEGMLVERITLMFPGRVQVTEFITYDGVMERRQEGDSIVLTGALLKSGFVQLRWRPASIMPISARLEGDQLDRTLQLADVAARIGERPEVRVIRNEEFGEAMIVRRGEAAKTLTLQFDITVENVYVVGLGCLPTLVHAGSDVVITGDFIEGATIDIRWEPSDARLIGGSFDDSPLEMGEIDLVPIGGMWRADPSPAFVGEPVTFRIMRQSGMTYSWDFGDGGRASGAVAEHTFERAGKYLVTLFLRTPNDKEFLYQGWLTVSSEGRQGSPGNIAPDAIPGGPYGPYDLVWDGNEWIGGEEEDGYWVDYYYCDVYFDASPSYDPDGEVVEYRWDFGDGTTVTSASPYVLHRVEVTIREDDPITDEIIRVPVTLTVYDDRGESGSSTTYAEFYNPGWWGGGE